jgi:hypothetical protein
MALVIKDRVKQTTTTTGTGTLTLNGTIDGFQTFAAALSDGDTTYYALLEPSTNNWEVGLGTWTEGSSLLARTTVLASSNSGIAVNLTAQTEVFISQPAGKAAFFSADGDLELTRDPQTALQAATKEYVDTIAAAGLHYHDPVRVEQEGNLSATYNNGTAGVGATLTNNSTQAALVVDGVTLSTADRVLVYEQTDATQNGVYTVTNTGSASTNWVLTRSTDTDSYAPSDPNSFGKGDAFFVLEGNAGAGELYVMNTEGTITFGTTNITFTQVASTAVYSAGNGVTLTGTVFAADAGTGVTVNGSGINIGQAVETTSDVTFNSVAAALTGNVSGNVTGDVTGNADTATALETARNIGGVSFDGTASINLPGVNTTGNQDTTGNAATATAWETGRTISLTGDVTGSVTGVDGTGNASIATTIQPNSVALGTDTTGNYVATVTSGNYLTGGTSGEGSTPTLNVDATPTNTASKVVARDASGNFSAGTITGALSGNATTASSLATGRSIALSGDVSGSTTFDGSGNVTITTAVADDSHNHVISNVDGLQTALDAKSPLANPDFTGVASFGNMITVGNSGTRLTGGTDLIEIYGSTASFHMGVQDGSGRVQMRWNASQGTNPTYQVSNEQSARYEILDVTESGDALWRIDHAPAGTAGNAISYTNILSLGTTTFNYNGNKVWHAGNDGSGSGLDADTVDGVHESTFMRKSANSSLDMNDNNITDVEDIYLQDTIFHEGDTDTYMQFHAADQWRVVTGGSERIEATNSGVRINNAYTLPTVAGTNGYVLTTNGSGTASWAEASGGLDETTATTSTTSQTAIASYSTTTYGAAKLLITVKRGTERQVSEMLIAHDGTTAFATEYGILDTGVSLASFNVDISGGNFRLLATSTSSTSTSYTITEILVSA